MIMFDIGIFDIIMIVASIITGWSLPQPWWAKLATDWIKGKIVGFFTKKRQ
jgi:hypothetical protein